MKPGPDAGIRNLGEGRHVGPTVGDPRGRWTGRGDTGNIRTLNRVLYFERRQVLTVSLHLEDIHRGARSRF